MRAAVHASPAAAALCLTLVSVAASAGALSVSPTRIELDPRKPIATLEVRNEAEETVTVQLERVDWAQDGGSDRYTESAELIATPLVFDLAPHGSQVLRIAVRSPQSTAAERAFRIYVCEVPAPRVSNDSGLRMTLRIGVPVFVEPPAAPPRLSGELHRQADGTFALRLRNEGGHFTRAVHVDLHDAAHTVLWESKDPAYLLAGGEHEWSLQQASIERSASAPLQLSVTTETGVEHIDARLSP